MGGRVCCGTRQDKKGSNQWVDVSVVALGRIRREVTNGWTCLLWH